MDDLVEVAASLRARSGQIEPAFSTRRIIDACFPDAIVTGRPLPDGIEEIVSRTTDGIVILYQRELPIPRQRFAIAHAIGHIIYDLHTFATVIDSAREARADAFASELLVPLAELEPYVGRFPGADDSADHDVYLDQVDEIASHFAVPAGLIDERIRAIAR